jgi:hypothetical protein
MHAASKREVVQRADFRRRLDAPLLYTSVLPEFARYRQAVRVDDVKRVIRRSPTLLHNCGLIRSCRETAVLNQVTRR